MGRRDVPIAEIKDWQEDYALEANYLTLLCG